MKITGQRTSSPPYHLVFTLALKKEVPKQFFASQDIPVCTFSALRSGALSRIGPSRRGVLVVITGAGPEESGEAARWIRDKITPLFVINVGTCGLRDREIPLGTWILPRTAAREGGESRELDTRFPLPLPSGVRHVDSLLSVERPHADALWSWPGHDAVDREGYTQARVFCDSTVSFHCLKFSTDYSDRHLSRDFNRNILSFQAELKELLAPSMERKEIGISVVIPVYNRRNRVENALRSVLSQTYSPEEIILVDDGSTDGTGDILKSYGDAVTGILLPENSGPSAARNTGLRHAQTEWVAFLDSDDTWREDKLRQQVEFLRRLPFYEILQSQEVWVRKGKRVNPCKHHEKPCGWIWEKSLERCLVSPSGVLMKKSLLERFGSFDESLPVCEDYDLWLKISRHHPVGLEPAWSVIKHGGHQDQLSRRYPAMDRFRVISLLNMLDGEDVPLFREKIIQVLEKKLKILIKGYEKRNKQKEVENCRGILETLARGQVPDRALNITGNHVRQTNKPRAHSC